MALLRKTCHPNYFLTAILFSFSFSDSFLFILKYSGLFSGKPVTLIVFSQISFLVSHFLIHSYSSWNILAFLRKTCHPNCFLTAILFSFSFSNSLLFILKLFGLRKTVTLAMFSQLSFFVLIFWFILIHIEIFWPSSEKPVILIIFSQLFFFVFHFLIHSFFSWIMDILKWHGVWAGQVIVPSNK